MSYLNDCTMCQIFCVDMARTATLGDLRCCPNCDTLHSVIEVTPIAVRVQSVPPPRLIGRSAATHVEVTR